MPWTMRMRGSKGSKVSAFEPMFKGYMLVRHFMRCRRLILHVVEAERVADQQIIRVYSLTSDRLQSSRPVRALSRREQMGFSATALPASHPLEERCVPGLLQQGRYNVRHGGMLAYHQ